MKEIIFSVIIPTVKNNIYLEECLNKLNNLTDINFEVIVVSEENITFKTNTNYQYINITNSEKNPGLKRDIGCSHSKGSYLAFIDDDAYPNKHWLKNALKLIENGHEIIGGPALNINTDTFLSKLLSSIFISIFAGSESIRNSKGKVRAIDDWHSVNLIVKKEIFIRVNGFDTYVWPGEDTILMEKLNNYNITYAPDVIVYHHRRLNLKKYIKQIFRYGYTRGYLFRKGLKNSKKIKYFLPLLFNIYILLLFLNFFSFKLFISKTSIIFFPLYAYLILNLVAIYQISKKENLFIGILSPLSIILFHLFYGIGNLLGILSKKYKKSLGR